jgi:multidrug efflux pump subunit AcrB
MALSALLITSFYSLRSLPLQKLPEFILPRVTVETLYPGMGAEDIRAVVTIPVEDALSSVKGLQRVRSVARDGASLTILDFNWGTDSGAASVLVREAIDAVYPGLPEGVSKPAVVPGGSDEEPQAVAAVSSPLGSAFARNLAEYEILPRLRRIGGVGKVILVGGEREELEFEADLPRSVSRKLPPASIAELLASETANIPAGNAREGNRELVVVSAGKPASPGELADLVFPSENGGFRLGDLGKLSMGRAKLKSLFVSADPRRRESGENSASLKTALEIYRRPGADPVRLSRELKKTLSGAAEDFFEDAEITLVYDDASAIMRGLKNLVISAVLGTLAVGFVLFFSLRRLRYSLLAGLSIPLSAAASFAALALGGRSLNTVSFSGIALGIGMVSDTAVIILDLLHSSFGDRLPHPSELSLRAASVASSSFGGTLTTAVVFIPLFFLPGPLGVLYGDLSLSLVVSITAGWAYAQFALPSLYRLFCPFRRGKKPENQAAHNAAPCARKRMARTTGIFAHKRIAFIRLPPLNLPARYGALLRFCLRRPLFIFGMAAFMCAGGLAFLLGRPAVFVSPGDTAELELILSFPPGTKLENMGAEAEKLAGKIAALPRISGIFGRAGAEDDDLGKRSDPDYRKEYFHFRCLFDGSSDPREILGELQKLMEGEKAGYEWHAGFPQDKTEKLLGLSSLLTLVLKAKDREELKERRIQAEKALAASEYVMGLTIRPSGLRPELRIIPNREASAYLGISTVETARAVYAAAEGYISGELEVDGKPLELRVSADLDGGLEHMPVVQAETGPVFLGSLARIERRESEAVLIRIDRSDAVYLDAEPKPGKRTELAGQLQELCGSVPGLSRSGESAFAQYRSYLTLTALLVLLLLYLAMGAEFESFILPLILMLAIPFSLAGSGPALFISGTGLDSSSVLGLLVLFGIAVNNGMIIYERGMEKISSGLAPAPAVYGAVRERCRSVLITALTTICALFPLTLSRGGQRSMAAAMLGGIAASVLLSLFALPPVFLRFFMGKEGKR